MNATPRYGKDQEIDLNYISNRIKKFFSGITLAFYRYLKMLYRNKWLVLVLIMVGVGYGYYLESNSKPLYKHEIIVAPNFKSVDYLYNQVLIFGSEQKDAKNCTIEKVKIEPITDIFSLITQKREYMDAFRVFADKVDFEKIIKETATSKNYRYHLLTVYTAGKDENGSVVNKFLSGLNNDAYYLERQKLEKLNTINRRQELEKSVAHINQMMESFGKGAVTPVTNEVNMNTYSDLDNVFLLKERFLEEMNRLDVEIIEQQKIIFDVSRISNVQVSKSIFLNKMILMPLLLLFLFSLLMVCLKFFRRLKQLDESEIR